MPSESEINAAFRKVAEEIRKKEIHSGPKARALAESNGNKDVARSLYIKYRAAELLEQSRLTDGIVPPPAEASPLPPDFGEMAHPRTDDAGTDLPPGCIRCDCGYTGFPRIEATGFSLTSPKKRYLCPQCKREHTGPIAHDSNASLERPTSQAAPPGKSTAWEKIVAALGFIVILFAMGLGGTIGKYIGNYIVPPAPTPQQIEEQLAQAFAKTVDEINRRGPTMVDPDTRLDGATVGPGARVTYHFTFPKYAARDIDVSALKQTFFPVVTKNVCSNKDMKPSIDYGATFVYAYKGNDGREIARVDITKSVCQP
ncbi:MAG: hypothetical protein IT496_02255 [Gammaproteobacteria bacterium]|nr:hypothetical protein [Gammaproteobacteria bacterium]